jgi:nicotinate-nucleotide pyrophosphorylase (carboxylating)
MLIDLYVENVLKNAILEDINYADVTTDFLIDQNSQCVARFFCKQSGVIAGIHAALRVFDYFSQCGKCEKIDKQIFIDDGELVKKGDVIAEIRGSTRSILKGERTALNLLQHLSGIATYTRECARAVAGTGCRVADTRKTLPGLRGLQKYAVLCGGKAIPASVCNHRFNLSSAAMLKDNHVDAFGSITAAVARLRERAGHTVSIEVEVRDLAQLREAIAADVDIILLDNMDIDTMKTAVDVTAGRVILEASGNVTLENIREIALTGVDVVSVGALTHSVSALDISLKIM